MHPGVSVRVYAMFDGVLPEREEKKLRCNGHSHKRSRAGKRCPFSPSLKTPLATVFHGDRNELLRFTNAHTWRVCSTYGTKGVNVCAKAPSS